MIELNVPEINVEDLMLKIREEILKRKNELNQSAVPLKNASSTAIKAYEGRVAEKSDYNLADFLDYEDEDFIRNAYRGILCREPDETGYLSSLNLLRNNPDSKIVILTNLRFSEEGKACAVTVHGLLKKYLGQVNDKGSKRELRMEPLDSINAEKINLHCLDNLDAMVLGQHYSVKVRLYNGSNRILSSTAPNPINLSYHWDALENSECVIYEGLRTALNAPCLLSSATEYEIKVKAPDAPGAYVLKIVAVQEGVRWHESNENATLRVNVTQNLNPLPITSTHD